MVMKALIESQLKGQVHCPICTHTVPAEIDVHGKRARVAAGQRCPRCRSSLDVAVIVVIPEAA
jgi:transposase-like protein